MGLFNKSKTPPSGGGLGRKMTRIPSDDGDVMALDRDVDADENAFSDEGIFPLDSARSTEPYLTEDDMRDDQSSAESRAIVEEVALGKEKKGGIFGRKGADKSKPEPKAKKGEKPSRLGRKKNASAEVEAGEKKPVIGATVERLSNRVIMDFLPSMGKEDAIETARHFALNHCQNPTNAFYTVMPIQDGYAYEVQEGVGKSYLSSVIDLATNNPNRLIVVPMLRRKMTVFYTPRSGVFEVSILDEGVDPPDIEGAEPITAVRGAAMRPVMKQYIHWLYTGVIAAVVGGVALLGSLAFYALDPQAKVPPEWRVTDVAQLPVMQWNKLAPDGTGSYVVRLEYTENAWRVVRQDPNAVVDAFSVEDSGTAGVAAGTVVAPVDGAAPTPVPAPGAAPSAVPPVPSQPAPVAPGAPAPQ